VYNRHGTEIHCLKVSILSTDTHPPSDFKSSMIRTTTRTTSHPLLKFAGGAGWKAAVDHRV
jgi:hypothetical protein